MPGNKHVVTTSPETLDKTGTVVPLQEEDWYCFVGNNRVHAVNLFDPDPPDSNDDIPPNQRMETARLGAAVPSGRTTCASDGEAIFIPTTGRPKWLGKNILPKVWGGSLGTPAFQLDSTDNKTRYYLLDATAETPESLGVCLFFRGFHRANRNYGTIVTPQTVELDPTNVNGPPFTNNSGYPKQTMGELMEAQNIVNGNNRFEVPSPTNNAFWNKTLITLPSRTPGALGFYKYFFGFTLVYDQYQETPITPLQVCAVSGNQHHYVESLDSQMNQLFNGESVIVEAIDTMPDNPRVDPRPLVDMQFGSTRDQNYPNFTQTYYTGWGDFPLEELSLSQDGQNWISGSGADGFELELRFPNRDNIPGRVTGCKVYAQFTATELREDEEAGTGDWFLVQEMHFGRDDVTDGKGRSTSTSRSRSSIDRNQPYWWANTGSGRSTRFSGFFDYMKINGRGTFEQSTGISSAYEDMDVQYRLCASVAGHLIAADVSYPDGVGGRVESEREILISEYDRFSIFDYAFKKLRIKHKPTAIIEYRGDMLIFEEGHTYLIDVETFQIREEWEGIGATGPESIAVTDRGIFFANRQNIYRGGEGRIEAIGNEIYDIAEYPERGYKQMNAKSSPTVCYSSTYDSIIVMWANQDSQAVGAMFSVTRGINDWTTHIHFGGSWPYKLFTSFKGKNYLFSPGTNAIAGHEIAELFTDENNLHDMLVEAKLTQIGNVRFKLYDLTVDAQESLISISDQANPDRPDSQTGERLAMPDLIYISEGSRRTIPIRLEDLTPTTRSQFFVAGQVESMDINVQVVGNSPNIETVDKFSIGPNETVNHFVVALADSDSQQNVYTLRFSVASDSIARPTAFQGYTRDLRVIVLEPSLSQDQVVASVKLENDDPVDMINRELLNDRKRLRWDSPNTNEWLTDVQFVLRFVNPSKLLSVKNIFATTRPQQIQDRTINV